MLFPEALKEAKIPAVVVELHSRAGLSVTPRAAARRAALSFTISWSLLRLTSLESMA